MRETLRSLGLEYEHNRPDRAHHVSIHNERIDDGKEHAYVQVLSGHDYDFLTAYDLSSVMHLRADANTASKGVRTMSARLPIMQHSLGTALRTLNKPMSHRDKLAINELFACAGKILLQ